ncbi:MAG: DoxX family protein [Paracoccaceae bacterium]
MNQLQTIAPLIGRVLLSVIFIFSGLSKIGAYAGTAGYMEMMGVPGALLPVVILVEVGAGIMLLIGWHARIAAVLLGGFLALSGIIFHLLPGLGLEDTMAQQAEMISFMKNMAIAGGMAFVFAFGAGKYSFDNRA